MRVLSVDWPVERGVAVGDPGAVRADGQNRRNRMGEGHSALLDEDHVLVSHRAHRAHQTKGLERSSRRRGGRATPGHSEKQDEVRLAACRQDLEVEGRDWRALQVAEPAAEVAAAAATVASWKLVRHAQRRERALDPSARSPSSAGDDTLRPPGKSRGCCGRSPARRSRRGES